MNLNYYPDTDSLYIDLSERASSQSLEISTGVVLDFDSCGGLVGIDLDCVSEYMELEKIELNKLPSIIEIISG